MNCKGQANPPKNGEKQNTNPATGEAETPEALLNDVVLENIFKFLGYEDLKSCRQMGNKTWLRNSKKAWHARTKVTLHGGEPILSYLSETDDVISSIATNYILAHVKVDYHGFWERVGHSIKNLKLWWCSFRSQDDFRHAIYTHCPNLEKLAVANIKTESSNDIVEPTEWEEPHFAMHTNLKCIDILYPSLPVSWMDLLSHFPNLQYLEGLAEYAEIFKSIAKIRQRDPTMLKLKRIQITTLPGADYDERIRSVFLDPNLALETINVYASDCRAETIANVLELHAKSLRKLILEGSGKPAIIILGYPPEPLQLLEELKISSCVFPVDMFKFTPNVRKIDLNSATPCLNNILEIAEPTLRVNTCTDLELNVNGESTDKVDSCFEFFLKIFPNVKTFHTQKLNNHKFSMVCEHYTKLVTLTIDNSEVDVSGLLGFEPDSAAGVRNPNITNLKDLQSFRMYPDAFGSTITMDNGGVVFKELKQLPHLKTFELGNYKFEGENWNWMQLFTKCHA